jgi:hypothetical protein
MDLNLAKLIFEILIFDTTINENVLLKVETILQEVTQKILDFHSLYRNYF